MSFQLLALRVQGVSHAIVVGDRRSQPLQIVEQLQLTRVCCSGRRCTLHRGPVASTWADPINTAENLKLVIPSHGEPSDPETMTNPQGVASVQIGPVEDTICPFHVS